MAKSYLNKNISLETLNTSWRSNIVQHIGIEYTEIGDDFLSGKMPVDERTMQPMNILHGGASVVLAETLGSVASYLCIDTATKIPVGLDINANHIRSATKGYVYGKATAVHIGRTTHVWQIEITDEEGKLVCTSRLTMAVIDKK